MVGLLKFQLSRAVLLAGAILFAASAACWALTPDQVYATAAAWHPMPAWIVAPAGIIALIVIIGLCAKFVRNDARADAQLRAESGDGPMTPVPGADSHIHFH